MKMSPFSAPFSWGTQKRGLLLPRRAAALWEGTQCFGEEPGKQKTRSCRTQELARSSAQEKEWQKKGGLLDSARIGVRSRITSTITVGKTGQKSHAIARRPPPE